MISMDRPLLSELVIFVSGFLRVQPLRRRFHADRIRPILQKFQIGEENISEFLARVDEDHQVQNGAQVGDEPLRRRRPIMLQIFFPVTSCDVNGGQCDQNWQKLIKKLVKKYLESLNTEGNVV